MRKITKQNLDEMGRTMLVIPESGLNSIVGAYADDCFWRCVDFLNFGTGLSEAAAAAYAFSYWTYQYGGCSVSAEYMLSTNGGTMLPPQGLAYKSYADLFGINLEGLAYMETSAGYHAIIFVSRREVNITQPNGTIYKAYATTVYDPATGETYETWANVTGIYPA